MSDIRLVTELTFNKFMDMFWHEDKPHYRPFSYDGLNVIWNDLQEFANETVVDGDTYTISYNIVNEMYDEYDSMAQYAGYNDCTMLDYISCGAGDVEQMLSDLESHSVYIKTVNGYYNCICIDDLRYKFLSALQLEPPCNLCVQNAINKDLFTEEHYRNSINAISLFIKAWLHEYAKEAEGDDTIEVPTFNYAYNNCSVLDRLSSKAIEDGYIRFDEFLGCNSADLFSCVTEESFNNAVDQICHGEIEGDFTEAYNEWVVRNIEKEGHTVVSGSDGCGVFVVRE